MAITVEKHLVESAAREAATALRSTFSPLEETCTAFGRIALLHFQSAQEAEIAKQLRDIARELKIQQAQIRGLPGDPRLTLKKILEMERSLRAIAIT